MNNYRYLNLNPDNIDTQDCVVRAISLLLGKDWEEVYLGICAEGLLQKKMPMTDTVWGDYLRKKGYYLTRLPTHCPVCYSVNDFAIDHPYGRFLLKVDEHVVTVVNGYYYDTWDSGQQIALYYWRKETE